MIDANSMVYLSFEKKKKTREDFHYVNSKPLKNFFPFLALKNNLRSLHKEYSLTG